MHKHKVHPSFMPSLLIVILVRYWSKTTLMICNDLWVEIYEKGKMGFSAQTSKMHPFMQSLFRLLFCGILVQNFFQTLMICNDLWMKIYERTFSVQTSKRWKNVQTSKVHPFMPSPPTSGKLELPSCSAICYFQTLLLRAQFSNQICTDSYELRARLRQIVNPIIFLPCNCGY